MAPCEFVALEASTFRKLISRRLQVLGTFREYARLYQQMLLSKGSDHHADIWCDFDETQLMAQKAFELSIEIVEDDQNPPGKLTRLWRSWSPHNFMKKKDSVGPPRRCRSL